jgi:UDP-N-acetylmuramoyl-L-alanyl-D-glutamate--2,6-diaminopimelate ligase
LARREDRLIDLGQESASVQQLPVRNTRGEFDVARPNAYEPASFEDRSRFMNLESLLAGILDCPDAADQIDISYVTADSRYVVPGALFAALPGARLDGARFVPDAVELGAAAILTASGSDIGALPVPVLRTDDPRRALALIAARFFEHQPETMVAVTGTSGKTSVADFTRQIFLALSRKAASIGTIGVVEPDGSVYGALTTPDPVTLHAELRRLADQGVTHLAFEASSHGLDQRRLDGTRVKAAAFTNLGRDHLDYHPTVEHYLAAKLRLFDTLLPGPGDENGPGTAVVDAAQPEAARIVEIAARRGLNLLRTGRAENADLRLISATPERGGQRLQVRYGETDNEILLPLIGDYQATNALLAAGLAIAVGERADAAFAALEVVRGVRGRLEMVAEVNGAKVVIDYAHKPDALAAALDALRPLTSGRLICVFGCGGDRDRGKRPQMGRISAEKADLTIVTDDNPRSEDPTAIRAEIMASCPDAEEIGDRYQAIAHAMMQLAPGDVLVIAGKGHETGQIVGDQTLPFSDHDAVEAIRMEF